ncbi:MAG TPA: S-layer homology domain-containing protein [Tissierellia bacterium]|nr:S-layer homology domain-containing protein [Tissierellia bacterium]
MKKVLSLVLVIAMVLSSFTVAFAAPKFEDVEGDYEKAINTLTGLGVITGYEDGTFRPERVVTRAEMAKLIVEILGYGKLVEGSKSNFTDTQGHWADPWIALAAGRGLVVGTGDGKFTPDRTVSYDEAITMIVRALGYTDDCNELKGMTWPTNFKVKAADLKLTKDVNLSSEGADRGGVAQLLFNALEANLVTIDSDGNVNYIKDGDENKILLNTLAKKNRFVVAPKHLDKDHKEYKGDIVDLAPYMYQDIKVFENDDDEVVYVTKVESEVKVGEFRKTVDDDGDVVYEGKVNIRIDGKNKAYKLASTDTAVFYNGVEVFMNEKEMETGREDGDTTKAKEIVDLHKAAATFVLNSKNEIVGIIAEKYTDATRVANEYNGKTKFEGFLLPLDDDDNVDYTKLTVKGAVDTLEDIEEDDVIVLFAGAGLVNAKANEPEKLVIEVVRDTVEGKITETNKDGDFYIDGKYYSTSLYAPSGLVAVGDEGTFFLDNKGDILDFEPGSESSPVDYAIVTEFWNGYVTGNGKEIKPEITLVNASGEEVTYNVKSSAKIKVGSTEFPLLGDLDDSAAGNDLLKVEVLDNEKYTIVKYSINSKNEITKMTLVNNGEIPKTGATTVERDTTKASYVIANNVVVFNLDGDDVKVVDSSKLGDKIDVLFQDKNKNGEINFLFVKGLGSSDTYAFITEAGTALNDDDVLVQKVTAYVNGEKKTYLTDAINTVTSSAIDAYKIYKLELDGDVIEGITLVDKVNNKNTQLIANETTVTRVTGNRIRIGENTWYTLADDVAVYVLDDYEFDEVGSVSSLYAGAKVAAYAFDEDNIDDNVIEILFVFE